MTRKTFMAPLIILGLAAAHCSATTRQARPAEAPEDRLPKIASAVGPAGQIL